MNKRKIVIPTRPPAAPERERPREKRTLHVRFGGAANDEDGQPAR